MISPKYLSPLLVIMLGALSASIVIAETSSPQISVLPTPPADISGGAQAASLQAAAAFAWQEFIALNWPAKAGQRDVPDLAQKFGAATEQPLVWHTYRSKIEIFPGYNNASNPPHGYTPGSPPPYGYNAPPQYVYNGPSVGNNGQIQACAGQAPVASPAWVNLDEIDQIGLDSMFAGTNPSAATPTNSYPQLIRFLAKANQAEYAYTVQNSYWYDTAGSPRKNALDNFVNAVNTNKFPAVSPTINFPAGTFEVKAAFRPLTAAEKNSKRFYSTRVRYYEQGVGENSPPCYREDQWGLVALHIIQKTPSAPAFVFATFEQADNLLTTAGGKTVAVEDENGNVVNPSPTATTPTLSYVDNVNYPQVTANGAFCNTSGNPHLFYQNAAGQTGVPTGGSICVNQRDHAIPSTIIGANQVAHQAIAAYAKANGVGDSPWAYYKLVNVQAFPFNKTDIVSDPGSPHNASTYYQSNNVVETNYTLQNFDGQVAGNGAPTNFNGAGTPILNTFILQGNGTVAAAYNMGGCMGCHGIAQTQRGGDFSFLMGVPPARLPSAPSAAPSKNTQQLKERRDTLLR